MEREQLRDLNLWQQTALADPSTPVVLSDFARSMNVTDVDFIKIDVDGEDFAILSSIADELGAWRVLGVGLEVNFFGSDNSTDHTFHNMDRFMRAHGFDLFNISVRRYSHAAMPSIYSWRNPSPTRTGRPLQGDAIYLRDVCAEDNEGFAAEIENEKLLKLAAIASLAGTPDSAAQILLQFRERLEVDVNTMAALELLSTQAQLELGFSDPLPYADYMLAFEADDPMFYTGRG
jgi:hypothetical protein